MQRLCALFALARAAAAAGETGRHPEVSLGLVAVAVAAFALI
jgi:hypothetical protein